MKKAMKLLIFGLIILGLTLSVLNFISVESAAILPNPNFSDDSSIHTQQADGCYGQEDNCQKINS